MEAPAPIYNQQAEIFEAENMFKKPEKPSEKFSESNSIKQYTLTLNNILYLLTISSHKNEINFELKKSNENILCNFSNKCGLKEVISVLKLSSEKYNDSKKILDLIEKSYENKKLSLKPGKKNEIFLIIRINLDLKEFDCSIKLIKNNYNFIEKFDEVYKEIKNLKEYIEKKDKLNYKEIMKVVEEKLQSIQKNMLEQIKILKEKLENNEKTLEKNKNDIDILKKELLNLKEQVNDPKKNKNKNILFIINILYIFFLF